ncbi:hypothetical protein HNP47_002368 [Brevundimonas vesicularis]|uniref:Uncharacterized protein n=1 Tax=Brevundimonas vesicularis TaxID=41276 RepID=A0A7W9L6G6_BREVE|nr:hypothetical protein [Brevundimonas vesicularis]MBB5772364.1 hypothetical protein [Brevundimonas vesicularis]
MHERVSYFGLELVRTKGMLQHELDVIEHNANACFRANPAEEVSLVRNITIELEMFFSSTLT